MDTSGDTSGEGKRRAESGTKKKARKTSEQPFLFLSFVVYLVLAWSRDNQKSATLQRKRTPKGERFKKIRDAPINERKRERNK